jgi:hypothetical protein
VNDGVKILLARMDSHPEEFADLFDSPIRRTSSRWNWVMTVLEAKGSFLSEEDRTALLDKYHSIQGDNFTQHVMRELLEDTKDMKDMKEIAFEASRGRSPHKALAINKLRPPASKYL